MKTASGCRSTNGCTPKYRDGFDGAAKMEAGPLKPTLPHSNDEDVRKSLRLNIWPFLSNATSLRYSDCVHLNCNAAQAWRQSARRFTGVESANANQPRSWPAPISISLFVISVHGIGAKHIRHGAAGDS